MSDSELWSLSILGILICAVLLTYIARQLRQPRQEPASSSETSESASSAAKTQLLGLNESLEVISRLVLDQQVEISEACMRIKVLLDHLDPSLHESLDFVVFSNVYEKLEHMPTHAARKQVDKKILFKLDQQRFQIEREYKSEVEAAAQKMLSFVAANMPQSAS